MMIMIVIIIVVVIVLFVGFNSVFIVIGCVIVRHVVESS
jgi:hypothetical protein